MYEGLSACNNTGGGHPGASCHRGGHVTCHAGSDVGRTDHPPGKSRSDGHVKRGIPPDPWPRWHLARRRGPVACCAGRGGEPWRCAVRRRLRVGVCSSREARSASSGGWAATPRAPQPPGRHGACAPGAHAPVRHAPDPTAVVVQARLCCWDAPQAGSSSASGRGVARLAGAHRPAYLPSESEPHRVRGRVRVGGSEQRRCAVGHCGLAVAPPAPGAGGVRRHGPPPAGCGRLCRCAPRRSLLMPHGWLD